MSTVLNTLQSAFNAAKSLVLTKSGNPRVLVDPLSCIIKEALLIVKPHGTKISFVRNHLEIDDVVWNQGKIRGDKNASGKDISKLRQPTVKAITWYDIERQEIKYIFEMATKGLRKLYETYEKQEDKDSPIFEALSMQVMLLEETLHGVNVPDILLRSQFKRIPQTTTTATTTSNQLLSLGSCSASSNSSSEADVTVLPSSPPPPPQPLLSSSATSLPLPNFFKKNLSKTELDDIRHRGFDVLWSEDELHAVFLLLRQLNRVSETLDNNNTSLSVEEEGNMKQDKQSIIDSILGILSCKDRAMARTVNKLTSEYS